MDNKKTIQNLMNAYAGESQVVQKYTAYAKKARKEGWANIAAIFEETATNEHYHAKEFYNLLIEILGEDNMPYELPVNMEYPVALKGTYENLLFAAEGESGETVDYKKFAKEAGEEGFVKVAVKFELIADVEAQHAKRYKKMADLLKVEQVIQREETVQWKCMKCGHIHTGKEAPGVCPICSHPAGYFQKYELNI